MPFSGWRLVIDLQDFNPATLLSTFEDGEPHDCVSELDVKRPKWPTIR